MMIKTKRKKNKTKAYIDTFIKKGINVLPLIGDYPKGESKNFDTYTEMIDFINNNIKIIMPKENQENQKCYFIPENNYNIAYIDVLKQIDKKLLDPTKTPEEEFKSLKTDIFNTPSGYSIRYYSFTDDYYITLDILQLFKIQNRDLNTKKAIKSLIEHFGLTIKEEENTNIEELLINNKKKIQDRRFKKKYPELHNYISKYFKDYYKILNNYRNVLLYNENIENNEPIINISVRGLSKIIKSGNSKAKWVLDIFSILGLLEKKHIWEVNSTLAEKEIAMAVSSGREKRPLRNFYKLPEVTNELLERANKISSICQAGGLKPSTLSTKKVKEVLGEEVYRELYEEDERNTFIAKKMKRKKMIEEKDLYDEEIPF